MASKLNLAIVLAVICCVNYASSQMVSHSKGKNFHTILGQNEMNKPVDDIVFMVCGIVFGGVEETLKTELHSLIPVSYDKQTVAGINYFIKAIATAKDGSKSNIELAVYRPLKGQLRLLEVATL